MSTRTVAELKELLLEKGLPTARTKNETIVRLLDAGFTEENLRKSSSRLNAGEGDAHSLERSAASPQLELPSEMELLRRERDLAEREIQM
ncbi:hypothetical protein KPH14_000881 [Odynerus spinipes]|uniref:SAP domain-containing protein n=1 Tax=Odynerus spinipes TaxID=1348599 RepID=A0AAD9RES5_9HYME|nr:hypothetical protein KPH14_000881 [Odynerus spinipes]